MDHQHSGDSGLAAVSFLFFILSIVGLGTMATVISILAGSASLFINWPSVKARVIQITKRFKIKS
jgi:hypothetical protein